MPKRAMGNRGFEHSRIPVRVSEDMFERFVLPCLSML